MSAVQIRFKPGKEGPFYVRVSELVNQYFKENGIDKKGNWELYLKTAIFFTLFISIYFLILFVFKASLVSLLLCFIEGIVFSGIGFCVMHDGNHGSYSTNAKVNKMMGKALNVLGGINFHWVRKHTKHHKYVNIDGEDEDHDFGKAVRMSPNQKHYFWHYIQPIYVPILYSIFYFAWITILDGVRYTQLSLTGKLKPIQHVNFWVTKILYGFFWVFLPIHLLGFIPWLIGYGTAGVTCSLIISFTFQLAHVVKTTEFLVPDKTTGILPDEFAIHQVKSSNDFAPESKVLDWFLGGLNWQIEHHLFPEISHVHYKRISRFIKQTCNEFNVTYNCDKNIWIALRNHMQHLYLLGVNAKKYRITS